MFSLQSSLEGEGGGGGGRRVQDFGGPFEVYYVGEFGSFVGAAAGLYES